MAKIRGDLCKMNIIGLVPTMGALHEGHLSLIRKAKKDCNIVIASIFVNPLQFGPKEDFKKYPRDLEKDSEFLKLAGCDILFSPQSGDILGKDLGTSVHVEGLQSVMCGASRPGHFDGVCTIVLKLFNIVRPGNAYFGLKDYQQFVIIKKMTDDLDMPVNIIGCPIIRDRNGLALSSRNAYLSKDDYTKAVRINKALREGSRLAGLKKLKAGEITALLKKEYLKGMKTDYLGFYDADMLSLFDEKKKPSGKLVLAGAFFVGNTRLIDNIIIRI